MLVSIHFFISYFQAVFDSVFSSSCSGKCRMFIEFYRGCLLSVDFSLFVCFRERERELNV